MPDKILLPAAACPNSYLVAFKTQIITFGRLKITKRLKEKMRKKEFYDVQ